jgi:hypothetical protein
MGVVECRLAGRTDARPAELRGALARIEAVRAELDAAPLTESMAEPRTAGDATDVDGAPAE